jgi:hypothetical protein
MIPLTFPRAIGTSIARFTHKDELNQWLTAHPTWRSAARLIRPKTAPGEVFHLLIEYADQQAREQAQLEDELHELHAMRAYQENSRRARSREQVEADVI